jgi:hypothetical protein
VERTDFRSFQGRQLVGLPALTAIRGDENPPSAADLGQPIEVDSSASELISASLDVKTDALEGGREIVAVDIRVEEEGGQPRGVRPLSASPAARTRPPARLVLS